MVNMKTLQFLSLTHTVDIIIVNPKRRTPWLYIVLMLLVCCSLASAVFEAAEYSSQTHLRAYTSLLCTFHGSTTLNSVLTLASDHGFFVNMEFIVLNCIMDTRTLNKFAVVYFILEEL